MFTEAFQEVLTLLRAGTGDIARLAQWDQSNVSRFRSGRRVSAPGGEAAARLAQAICAFAEESGQTERLSAWCGCPEQADAGERQEAVSRRLFAGEEPRSGKKRQEHTPYASIGDRLDRFMKALDLSNVRLGRMINLDASYISRFRSGQRSPRSNPKIMSDLCRALCGHCISSHAQEAAARLTGISPLLLTEEEEGTLQIQRWLFDETGSGDTPTVERLLSNVDSFSMDRPDDAPLVSSEELQRLREDRRVVYDGHKGLQEASLRFLAQILAKGRGAVMMLYSDQSIEWLVEPEEFGKNGIIS